MRVEKQLFAVTIICLASAVAHAETTVDRFDSVDGLMDLRIDPAALQAAGLDITLEALQGPDITVGLEVTAFGTLHATVEDGVLLPLAGDLHLSGQPVTLDQTRSARERDSRAALTGSAWRLLADGDGMRLMAKQGADEIGAFRIAGAKISFDSRYAIVVIKGALELDGALSKRLRLRQGAGHEIGTFQAEVRMRNVQTTVLDEAGNIVEVLMPSTERGVAGGNNGTVCDQPVGPDVIVGDLYGTNHYSAVGNIEAYSVATESCNIGDANLLWISSTNQHPVIGQNMYQLDNDRFRMIGMSWLKHGFTALTLDECGCGCSGQGGSVLGVGCSDPYSAGLNGSQGNLGPRSEVNAFTGVFTYPYVNQGCNNNSICKRLQVNRDDLNPAVDGGGLYFIEGQYVAQDDAQSGNGRNSSSYRRVTVNTSTYNLTLQDLTQREQPAIRAWRDNDPSVIETDVNIPNEGLVIVAAKSVSLGGGNFRYEYAVQNVTSDRSIRSFSVPVAGAVSNIGFHDVDHHSGEPFATTDWTASIASGQITWSTDTFATNSNANALRWGTLYNFWFETNATPVSVIATLGVFKPGTPSSVTAVTTGPAAGPVDCNSNGVDDADDVANGTSPDCNGNFIPDECENFGTCDLIAVQVASGLSSPVYVTAPEGDSRLFIVEQGGTIRILSGGSVLGTPYLTVSPISSGGERGLLSMAFHPNFASNGFFYVNYTNTAGHTVVARYTATGGNPASNTANAGSAVILKTINQDFSNHNGGQLQFGPDGMLYVGMGDGGSADDPNERSQNDGSLLGKMLRLDVDSPPTYIPADNPYVGAGNPLDEIWAKGLRNPWRFSFDRLNGDMYIGDVGQGAREEVSFQPADSVGGENYGWDCREGFIASPAGDDDCSDPPYVDPILDVTHAGGVCSITGGYVYRGCDIPQLSGTYFYADFCADWIRSFQYSDGDPVPPTWTDRTSELGGGLIGSISSFGEDGFGELYIVAIGGSVYKIVCDDGSGVCGNGTVEGAEQCDDGNTDPGDGCDENCQIETGINDDCADAIAIFEGSTPFDTNGATTDGPAHSGQGCTVSGDGGQTYHDIWYVHTATCSGTMTVDICNASHDSDLVIYSNTNCGSLNFLACNDDACGAQGFRSRLDVPVTQGQDYLIRVGGWNNGDQGSGSVILSNSGSPCGPVCGDGTVEGSEECDPPNGTTCDAMCMLIFDDCNGNGIDDLDDIADCTGDPACGDCNNNSVPDGCDLASGSSTDCDGGPIGVVADGSAIINTFCFGCHNTDGSGGGGFPGPNIRGKTRVEIWNKLQNDPTHPGGQFPGFTQQDFADLEYFLLDTGSRGRPDLVPDECQSLADCDIDAATDACELEAGTQVDNDLNGIPDDCDTPCVEPCDDGNPCTINDACAGNVCIGTPVDCSGSDDACNVASCDFGGAEGNCDIITPRPNGTACDDSDACTIADSCQSGSCTSGSPTDCSGAGDQCNVASCNPGGAAGNCSIITPLANGSSCDDGNACTVSDTCQAGACASGNPPDCSGVGDDCNGASCDPVGAEGNCDNFGVINEGGPCNAGSGTCANGTCIDPGDTRVFVVRAGQQGGAPTVGPTTITMSPGSTATVEVWAADTDGVQLGAFQFSLPGVAAPDFGSTGSVTYVDNPDALGGNSVFIDTAHPSWVFSGASAVPIFYSEVGLPVGFAALAGLDVGSGFVIPDGEMRYLGEFALTASLDASGSFQLAFLPDGAQPNGGSALIDSTAQGEIQANYQPLQIQIGDLACLTAADCADPDGNGISNDNCRWYDCDSGTCLALDRVFADAGGPFDDCTIDGFTNVHDRNHVLRCFAGTNSCADINIDVGGPFGDCNNDGFCNVHDANHANLAFSGVNPCSCPSNPAPEFAPMVVGGAGLELMADRNAGRGEEVAVQVRLAGPLDDLQSYQLATLVTGGTAGSLELVDIVVASRKDDPFAGRLAFDASNVVTGQMLRGLPDDGVGAGDGAYLATFVFVPSSDASGTFVVDLDPVHSFLVATGNGMNAITTVAPARITINEFGRTRARK